MLLQQPAIQNVVSNGVRPTRQRHQTDTSGSLSDGEGLWKSATSRAWAEGTPAASSCSWCRDHDESFDCTQTYSLCNNVFSNALSEYTRQADSLYQFKNLLKKLYIYIYI